MFLGAIVMEWSTLSRGGRELFILAHNKWPLEPLKLRRHRTSDSYRTSGVSQDTGRLTHHQSSDSAKVNEYVVVYWWCGDNIGYLECAGHPVPQETPDVW